MRADLTNHLYPPPTHAARCSCRLLASPAATVVCSRRLPPSTASADAHVVPPHTVHHFMLQQRLVVGNGNADVFIRSRGIHFMLKGRPFYALMSTGSCTTSPTILNAPRSPPHFVKPTPMALPSQGLGLSQLSQKKLQFYEKMDVINVAELKPSISGKRSSRPSSSTRHVTN